MKLEQVEVGAIIIGKRARVDMGDISDLAESMRSIGLLQPVLVRSDYTLIAGGRRLESAKRLGWTVIDTVVCETMDEEKTAKRAQRDENTCRKPFTPSELVSAGKDIEEREKSKAAERKGGRPKSTKPPKTPSKKTEATVASVSEDDEKGKVVEKVAEELGTSPETYRKAKAVAQAAEESPDQFGDLVPKMDAEGVKPAHEELVIRKASKGVDAWGIPIQAHAEKAFAAVPQFKELLALVRKAQQLFNEIANTPGGKFLTLPAVSSYRRGKKDEEGEQADRFVMQELDAALQKIKNAVPTHTVCPWNYVKTAHPSDCKTCYGLNWTTPLTKNAEVAKDAAKEAFGV